MPWLRFIKVYWSSLQGIHYGQALGGRTTRVIVFAEDSDFKDPSPSADLRVRISARGSDAAITPQVKVFAEDSEFRSFPFGPTSGSGFRLAARTPRLRLKLKSSRKTRVQAHFSKTSTILQHLGVNSPAEGRYDCHALSFTINSFLIHDFCFRGALFCQRPFMTLPLSAPDRAGI